MIKPYECTQCGSTDFEDVSAGRVRCAHCGSLFRVLGDEPGLVIRKGANVTFGANAQVEIRGDVEIEPGANVDIEGDVTVVNGRGKRKRRFRLELISGENTPASADP
jgi:uncharacterized Zn finger protein